MCVTKEEEWNGQRGRGNDYIPVVALDGKEGKVQIPKEVR